MLLWVGLFLDPLESFTPINLIYSIPTSGTSSSFLQSTESTTETTITLPSFDSDDEPSPLHKLHVRSLLSDQEVSRALEIALNYAQQNSKFQSPDDDRHVSFATCDFPVDECEELETFLDSTDLNTRLFDKFAELYGIEADDLAFDDLFVAYYQAKNGDTSDNIMDRLELHRDGSLFSVSLLLNPPDEFEGGGTFYDALRDEPVSGILCEGGAIRPERAGDAVLHCGKILHGADVVTKGRRVVLVGFIDLSQRSVRRGVLGNACKEWGRQDVALARSKRQEAKQNKGWVLNHGKWLQSATSAIINTFVPASSGILRRADPERGRRNRLEAEDALLRTILLPPDERGPKEDEFVFPFEEISFLDGEEISFLPEMEE